MLKFSFIVLVMLIFACSKNANDFYADKKIMKTDIAELSKRSGVNFSEKTRIIAQEDNLGGTQEAQSWLIYSDKALTLPKDEIGYREENDAREYLENFKKNAREEDFGTLKSDKSLSANWLREDGLWRKEPGNWDGTIIETDKGFYLELEWVKQ